MFINNKDKTAETWKEIFRKLGVFILKKQGFSDTICKACQSSALKAQKSLKLISKWNKVLQSEHPNEFPSPKKRTSSEFFAK